MTINPFIPIPVMAVICVLLLVMKRRGVWNYIKQIVIVLLLFGLNLRILIPTDTTTVMDSQVDVLIVVDNTISMLAEDYSKDNERRIDAVKRDVATIVDGFEGARFALITFNNRADCIVPYTTETNLILQNINSLEAVLPTNAEGTSLNLVISTIEDTLYRNLEHDYDENEELANKDIPKRLQVMFIISDGEITNKERLHSYEVLSDYVDTGAVLGYGTEEGATMKVFTYLDGYVDLKYYDDNLNMKTAISCIDEDNLKQIAEDVNIDYYHMENKGDVDTVIDDINDRIEDGEFVSREEKQSGYKETYHWFALGLLVLISVDYIYTRLKMRHER